MKPKILIFDIETKPVLAWIWRVGNKIRIDHDQIKRGDRFDIICICWKWLHERETHALDWGIKAQDSTAMIEKFTKVVESADIVVAHNGDQFDIKQLNTQRLLHDQAPISWPTSEDTLKQFRKHFAFPSYKLDYLAKTLVGGGKNPMKFQDWIDIVENKDPISLAKMVRYCKNDVRQLAMVFEKAEKHMAPRASRTNIIEAPKAACKLCGSMRTKSKGLKYLATGVKQRRQCMSCTHAFTI